MDMFFQDDDRPVSQQQSQNSGNEEFSSRTRLKESALSNGNHVPPLLLAIANSHLEVAELLIAHGADPNSRDEHGRTPLHVCAEYADGTMTGLLLEHGASMETQDKNGMTPLQLAASKGALGVVERLVRHGARVNL
jgi:ankyrin repeat protein